MTSSVSLQAALLAALQAKLPAQVSEAGAPPILNFRDYDPDLDLPNNAPELWLTVVKVRPAGPVGMGVNAIETRNRVVKIGITSAGNDVRTAEHALLTYMDLIRATMLADQTAAGQGTQVRCTDAEVSPNFGGGMIALFKLAVLTFEITRWSQLGVD